MRETLAEKLLNLPENENDRNRKNIINHEIISKMIGPIRPVGETYEDNQRIKNLEEYCDLCLTMIRKIDAIAYDYRDARERSIKRAQQMAYKFINAHLKE